MIDRQSLVALLSGLPDDKLMKLLSVAVSGDSGGQQGPDFMGALGVDAGAQSNNHIVSWNDRSVPYSNGADRPAIADKKWAEGAGGVGQAQDPRMGQIDDGVDPTNIFLQTGGGA